MALRIIFMGTPDFSVPVLNAIVAAGHEVVAVYTQPPRPAGRGMEVVKSPVQNAAEARGLPVFSPVNFKDEEARAAFRAHNADAAVVVAYGLILPSAVLAAPKLGCFNVHASLLPRWRGAAPIQRAIMAGDAATGVMVMAMEKGLDTGPVCLTHELAIGPDLTAGELHDQLSVAGAGLMAKALGLLETGALPSVAQSDEGVTYAAKIDKSETKIDFNRSCDVVVNHIRGLSPTPGAWFSVIVAGKPERVKVLRGARVGEHAQDAKPGKVVDDRLTVACAEGAIELLELQRAGKRPASRDEFQRGFRLSPGTQLD